MNDQAVRRFAALVLKEHRNDGEPGDLDGGWLQDTAELCGLIQRFEVDGPCGEACLCEDSDYCFRLTETGSALMALLAAEAQP